MEKLISSTNLQQPDKFAHKHSFIFTDSQGSAQKLQQFLKLDYHIQEIFFYLLQWKLFLKWWEVFFISSKQLFLFSGYLHFCLQFLVI